MIILGYIFTTEAQVAMDHSQIMLENTNLWSACTSAAVIEQHNDNDIFIQLSYFYQCAKQLRIKLFSQKNNNSLWSRLKHSVVFLFICCCKKCLHIC